MEECALSANNRDVSMLLRWCIELKDHASNVTTLQDFREFDPDVQAREQGSDTFCNGKFLLLTLTSCTIFNIPE